MVQAFPRMVGRVIARVFSSVREALWNGLHRWRADEDPFDAQVPWITYAAFHFIRSVLPPDAVIFEYGSGGSTLFYGKNYKRVMAVEHDPDWGRRVQAALQQAGLHTAECRVVPPQPDSAFHARPDDPEGFGSGDFPNASFLEYVSTIDAFPDETFDLVSVDGRARPACVRRAWRKVKIGGYLLLDNSERPYYRRAMALLDGWDKRTFYGSGPKNSYKWETTLWRRPG